VSVALDDVANDGRLNEGDNIRSDVEDVTVDPGMGTAGRATLTGNGQFNILDGGPNNDTLDGREGTDVLNGDEGDDTINARDGVVDRIDCGNGTDTANVDQFDDVRNCETVNRADVAVATPDRQPTVAFEQPASNTLLSPDRASTIRVAASDDRGISRVVLFDEDRAVGQDTTAPYEFSYQPRGDDVGKDTLVATAVDTSEQASVATRNVRVDRFLPSLRGVVRPARDRRAPYRFRVTGGIQLPRVVTAAQACTTGFVSVQVKRGKRTISTRRVRIRRTCGFSSTVTFRNRRRVGTGRLSVTVRWLGNAVLAPRTAQRVRVRAG
jgi:hypothetical protein